MYCLLFGLNSGIILTSESEKYNTRGYKMFIKNLHYKIRNIKNTLNFDIFKRKISYEFIFFSILSLFFSFLVISSIYKSVLGFEKYQVLSYEEQVLEDLKSDQEDLLKQKDFYSSKYYTRLYGREVMNLAEPDQELFFIKRDEVYEYKANEVNPDPIDVSNYKKWWMNLVM